MNDLTSRELRLLIDDHLDEVKAVIWDDAEEDGVPRSNKKAAEAIAVHLERMTTFTALLLVAPDEEKDE